MTDLIKGVSEVSRLLNTHLWDVLTEGQKQDVKKRLDYYCRHPQVEERVKINMKAAYKSLVSTEARNGVSNDT